MPNARQQTHPKVSDHFERRRAEEQERRSAATLSDFVRMSPFGLYVVDAQFRLSEISPGAEKVFGNIDPLLGRDFAEILRIIWPEPFASEAIGRFRHTLETGEPYHAPDTTEKRGNVDQVESYDWKIERIRLPDGQLGVICHFYDATRLRQAEQALRDADRRKNEFLAMLGHELRNPLAPVRTWLEILKQSGGDAEEVQQAVGVMERQVDQMVRLIDDLSDVSRISRGKLELRRQPVELADVIQDAVEISRALIEKRGHLLSVELPSEPVVLDGDQIRLAQAFANLLNNAAKYTERRGSIDVEARPEDGEVVVSVKDNGIGIAAGELETVFEMFAQAEGSLSRARGGLGIGLSLVKQLIEMHGGTIEARSEGPGKGSEFVVRLPVSC